MAMSAGDRALRKLDRQPSLFAYPLLERLRSLPLFL
jgi:hypothetical protein